MADLDAICQQLAAQIKKTQRHDYSETSGMLDCSSEILDDINPPFAVVALRGAVLDVPTARQEPGMDSFDFSVIVYLARSSDVAGQQAMKAYLTTSGPTSIREAILSDHKLGGLLGGGTVRVNGWDPPGEAIVGDVSYFAVQINCSFTCTPDRIVRRGA